MLADNIGYLKKNEPVLYQVLKNNESDRGTPSVMIETAKNNTKTLKIKKNDMNLYLHSKYDPLREAELIIDELEKREEITEDTHVIFYGLGLGYHVNAFLNRYPQNSYSIYEPSVEVLDIFLSQISLKNFRLKQLICLQCEYDENQVNVFFDTILTKVNKTSIICEIPAYQKVFTQEYQLFLSSFRNAIKKVRSALHTDYAFKRRWILNSVMNFKEVLSTPNILMENMDVFKGKTAILVSAGPSLNYEIENLKKIKANKSACIFSVGSSINTLLYHKIMPDVVCTYDPTRENQLAFKMINKENIVSVPMIFGSSVGFETLAEYKGPKYHSITSQDIVSRYYLKVKSGQELMIVNDAPTIAAVTLQLIYKLGFEKAILVGQNLAYLNNKYYAEGIDYRNIIEIEKEKGNYYQEYPDIDNLQGTEMQIDVDGNEVHTNDSFIKMKKALESYIEEFDLLVINTTKGGIKIEGAEYKPMDEIVLNMLKPDSLDGNEFSNIQCSELYDKTYLEEQHHKMIIAYENYQGLLNLLKQQLIKIDELIVNKNTKQANLMYQKLDKTILALESNDFAKVFAIPMNRVEHQLLARNIKQIQNEKNEFKRITALVTYINAFVNLLFESSALNKKIMIILAEQIGIAATEN